MSTSARLQICLYDDEKVRVELRPHADADALMFSIDGADGGFCLAGPPERVREVLAAIASLSVGELASKASAAQRPPDSSVAETPEEEH